MLCISEHVVVTRGQPVWLFLDVLFELDNLLSSQCPNRSLSFCLLLWAEARCCQVRKCKWARNHGFGFWCNSITTINSFLLFTGTAITIHQYMTAPSVTELFTGTGVTVRVSELSRLLSFYFEYSRPSLFLVSCDVLLLRCCLHPLI